MEKFAEFVATVTPTKPSSAVDSIVDDVFWFRIGDLVVLRTDVEAWQEQFRLNGPTPTQSHALYPGAEGTAASFSPLIILERHLQQCHGGIQLQYDVRARYSDSSHRTARFNEFELVAWSHAAEWRRQHTYDLEEVRKANRDERRDELAQAKEQINALQEQLDDVHMRRAQELADKALEEADRD